MHFLKIAIATLALLFAGCSSDGAVQEIELHHRVWQAQQIHDYAYTISGHCFCGFGGRGRVVVEQSEVVLATNESLAYTIDGLFEQMSSRASTDPPTLTVSYDPTFAYPNAFDTDRGLNDSQWGFAIDCFSLDTDGCQLSE